MKAVAMFVLFLLLLACILGGVVILPELKSSYKGRDWQDVAFLGAMALLDIVFVLLILGAMWLVSLVPID